MHPERTNGYLSWVLLSVYVFMLLLGFGNCSDDDIFSEPSFKNSEPFLNDNYGSFPTRTFEKLPSSLLHSNFASCEDLSGVGSLNETCLLNSSLQLVNDLLILGTGSLEVASDVLITCPVKGCLISFNISGNVKIGSHAAVVAGSVVFDVANLTLDYHSIINTTALGGAPPSQTSGTPSLYDGAGGGHGGRGASCLKSNKTNWGGDVYAWSSLSDPWSYGSKGGSTSAEKQYGGDGGGRVLLKVKDTLQADGYVAAEGGNGGLNGGGGSGGSIMVHAFKLKGNGTISAAGGSGWGGGGGGRVSWECYSIQDVKITVHGGQSYGCPENAGAAGTAYDKLLSSLKVSNDNFTTHTETPLLDFPTTILWSNVYVECNAKALVPLLWSRVQVRGQIRLLDGGSICFGLSEYGVSEFELVAEELLLSDSVIQVYGAFRIFVKMLLMWNSSIQIDGGGNNDVRTSVLETRNLIVLRQNSVIFSNADLGVCGQGLLRLTGYGDAIKAQRLFLSLFYNIEVGPSSLLQAPLDDDSGSSLATQSHCDSQTCPMELIMPPDDCHVNNSLSFTLQICRVDDLTVNGVIRGTILHIHRARTVTIEAGGVISASELGCKDGIGKGKFQKYGAGGGAGHGGCGGSGFYNGMLIEGGQAYGDPDLPCELGSGSGGPSESLENVAGGGMIVMGSIKWPLSSLKIYGLLKADGQSHSGSVINNNGTLMGGLGGGSGGTILLFLQALTLEKNSSLSVAGGHGGPVGGGGGGGGRVHFDWSNIATGDEYVQIATVNGTIMSSGGTGNSGGQSGQEGTITGKECPKGLYGTFCEECPVGTYKDTVGSNASLCIPCSLESIPTRADFIYVRGGVTRPFCPYRCLSEKYKMPKCYTPLEDLVYTFGGPCPFALLVSFILVLLALLLSALRIKMLGNDLTYQASSPIQHDGSNSFPYLLSLAEVPGASRAEETQSHVHRMYFMGPNTFREPWHLPYTPPDAIIGLVYEDAFNRFIDEINSVAAYEWWEGSIHSILSVLAYPCAWSWKQWRRRKKILRLQDYVRSKYDHSCLRSCRSRALYKGMKVGSTPDLMVAYIDFFLGGDEKRLDVASTISKRFPMCIIFGGDGSFMSPYNLHSDVLLTNLIGQYVSTTVWNRLVAGLNAQLRTVTQRRIRSALIPVITWINSHGNPQLDSLGVRIELGWFQATASGYYQLGILAVVNECFFNSAHQPENLETNVNDRTRKNSGNSHKGLTQSEPNQPSVSNISSRKRMTGGVNGTIINDENLQSLHYKRDFLFPFSLLLQNTRPIGFKDALQLLISIMLLGDLTITLLTLLQYYWMSLGAFLALLLILPLSLISPFPAGINALFSRGPRRSSLARIYALWNATSISNIIVAFICGICYYGFSAADMTSRTSKWNTRREDNEWWVLPTILFLVKSLQAGFVNWHIANLEMQDFSLYSEDPEKFWEC
ncbi:Growth factor receptor cysteine-rich domain-containing protein [Dioscorea alata]|uniref:Growth factor receptor cysteine-rich domain-containing protein n=1 Tax=Dioscorea alata TaxID=55571 RepID=A0ACB7WH98_DIOAL|nr:Growth factor receptor cysteine-rich domain-containing protein [Dioscorea alata]